MFNDNNKHVQVNKILTEYMKGGNGVKKYIKSLGEKVNGKKKYVAIPAMVISLLIPVFLNLNKQVAVNAATNSEQEKQIDKLCDLPEQLARVEERVDSLKEHAVRQEKVNFRFDDKLDKIMEAVLK